MNLLGITGATLALGGYATLALARRSVFRSRRLIPVGFWIATLGVALLAAAPTMVPAVALCALVAVLLVVEHLPNRTR